MKSIIPITVDEFRQYLEQIIRKYSEICINAKQDISIVISKIFDEKQYYIEVATIMPFKGGALCEYNKKALDEFGLSPNAESNKVKMYIDELIKLGLAENAKLGLIENSEFNGEISSELQKAINIFTLGLTKILKKYEI